MWKNICFFFLLTIWNANLSPVIFYLPLKLSEVYISNMFKLLTNENPGSHRSVISGFSPGSGSSLSMETCQRVCSLRESQCFHGYKLQGLVILTNESLLSLKRFLRLHLTKSSPTVAFHWKCRSEICADYSYQSFKPDPTSHSNQLISGYF